LQRNAANEHFVKNLSVFTGKEYYYSLLRFPCGNAHPVNSPTECHYLSPAGCYVRFSILLQPFCLAPAGKI